MIFDAELKLGHAYLKMEGKHLPLAVTCLQGIIDRHSTSSTAWADLGSAYVILKNYSEASDCFQKSLSINDSVDTSVELAWCQFLMGSEISAQESLELIDKSSNSFLVKFRLASVYWRLGGQYVTDKKYLHSFLIDAIKLHPKYAPLFSLLGLYYSQAENDLIRAKKCFIKALSIQPNLLTATKSLCEIYILQNHISEAIVLLSSFVEASSRSFWAWKQLGILHLVKFEIT